MADLAAKKSNHISKVVSEVTQLLDTVKDLKELRDEYLELSFVDGDFVGSNKHLDATILGQIMAALGSFHTSASSGSPALYSVLRQAKP